MIVVTLAPLTESVHLKLVAFTAAVVGAPPGAGEPGAVAVALAVAVGVAVAVAVAVGEVVVLAGPLVWFPVVHAELSSNAAVTERTRTRLTVLKGLRQ